MKIAQPTQQFQRDLIHELTTTLGRSIYFETISGYIQCPVCGGTDPFCQTCDGRPFLESKFTYPMTAVVHWKGGDDKVYLPEGQLLDGDCTVRIEYSEDNEHIVRQSRRVTVDNRVCVIDKVIFRGSPFNRIIIALKEDIIDPGEAPR